MPLVRRNLVLSFSVKLSIKAVGSLKEALNNIKQYSLEHIEAIIS
jgi:gamma-glutamyl phosphate reductase